MQELHELRRARADLDAAINQKQAEERRSRNAALVGRCFVYRASSGSPHTPEEIWPIYQAVVSLSYEGHPVVFSAQEDANGAIVFKTETVEHLLYDKEIPARDFDAALDGLKAKVAELSLGSLSSPTP